MKRKKTLMKTTMATILRRTNPTTKTPNNPKSNKRNPRRSLPPPTLSNKTR